MKTYDLYVVMAPADDSISNLGYITEALVNSSLKVTRHVGDKSSHRSKADIDRLVDQSEKLLYISDEANNRLETSVDAVLKADADGVEIYVLRLDNSSYPSEIAHILANSRVYDAIDSNSRANVIDSLIRDLGGSTEPVVTPDQRPTTPDAEPTVGPETEEDAEEDATRVIRRPQSTWTIVIEILLAIIIIAGAIALALK